MALDGRIAGLAAVGGDVCKEVARCRTREGVPDRMSRAATGFRRGTDVGWGPFGDGEGRGRRDGRGCLGAAVVEAIDESANPSNPRSGLRRQPQIRTRRGRATACRVMGLLSGCSGRWGPTGRLIGGSKQSKRRGIQKCRQSSSHSVIKVSFETTIQEAKTVLLPGDEIKFQS